MRLPTHDFGATVVGPPLHAHENWFQWAVRTLRETANPNTMHTEDLTPVELEKQASFESLDYYKPYPDMYVEYLRENHQSRAHQYMEAAASPSVDGVSPVSAETESAMENLPGSTHEGPAAPPRGVHHDHHNLTSSGPANTSVLSSSSFAGLTTASPMQQVMNEAFPILQMDKEERHAALRWLLHVLIALSVGIVATFVSYAVDFLEKYRAEALVHIMRSASSTFASAVQGYVFTVVSTIVLMAVAAGVVVFFEPAAAGGGIPDVMAYLNGVHLRKAMNLRTFIAKTISCICAVAGGLPVGLEAPLIHLGAITGAGMTQGRSRTLGFQTKLFQAFRNNKDRRDFITAGAACGVSVAFGAPIGGLLFVMEEVSSFWDQSSNGQIFLATMLCFTFSTIINSIVEDRRLLGWVSNAASVLFEVNLTIPLNLVSIVPSLLLGLIIGSMAAFFTKVNLMLIKWRRRVLRPYPFRRFLEPVVVGAIFASCMYALALIAPCADTQTIQDVNDTYHIWGTEASGRLFNVTCAKAGSYSPLGTLNMASGKNTIRHLFSRQTVGEFGVADLVVYFFIYFAFAILSSGTAVAGGLVVPSLVMGAVFGRLYGLLLFKMGATGIPGVPNSYAVAEAWMDPGVFALIGAGAFLAGTSRMTMAICVIMVELSAELHYLLPVMVAIVLSKSTADWLCEPLYHQMLMMDSVPYLPQNIVKPEFEQLTAADVMASEVVMLRMRERTETVLAALRDSTHHAFPVVEAELDDLLEAERAEVEAAAADANREGSGVSGGRDGVTAATSGSFTSPLSLGSHPRGVSSSVSNTSSSGGRHGSQGRTSTARHAVPPTARPKPHSLDDPSAHVRYKFVGLVTREDLQVYFTLPQLQEYDPSPSSSTDAVTAAQQQQQQPVPLTAEDSDGFGGRLAPCVLAIRKLSWQQWMTQKSKLFFATSDRYEWVRTHIPDGAPAGVDVGAENASFISENRLPPVVDLSLIVNRSPWVIPPFFNLQMAYHTFRMMGLRHMVVVDGDAVTGMITRKDLLVDALRRRMKELSARLAVADSAAPSLPPSHTNRSNPPHGSAATTHRSTPRMEGDDGEVHFYARMGSDGAKGEEVAGRARPAAAVQGAERDPRAPVIQILRSSTSDNNTNSGVPSEGWQLPQHQSRHDGNSNRNGNYRATASAWTQLEHEADGALTPEETILRSASAGSAGSKAAATGIATTTGTHITERGKTDTSAGQVQSVERMGELGSAAALSTADHKQQQQQPQPQKKLTSPLSSLFGSASSSADTKMYPGDTAAAKAIAAASTADVVPSLSPPPRATTQPVPAAHKEDAAKAAANTTSTSTPPSTSNLAATAGQRQSARRPMPPDAEVLFDLSVIKSPRDPAQE